MLALAAPVGSAEFVDPVAGQLWTIGYQPLGQWFAAREPWPPTTVRQLTHVLQSTTTASLVDRMKAEQGVTVPPELQEAFAQIKRRGASVLFWTPDMIDAPPWQVGTESQRWEGYLDPHHYDGTVGQGVLRNLVGATTYDELRVREDAFVAARGTSLHIHGLPASYDLAGLQGIHRHLFSDVYPWAGELRTVPIAKGAGTAFCSPEKIEPAFAQVAALLDELNLLRDVAPLLYPETLGRIYNAVNTIHPFREGNGRTQREFVSALAAKAGYTLEWTRVAGIVNDLASEYARRGDHGPMTEMFQTIVARTAPSPNARSMALPGAVTAAYPRQAADATRSGPRPGPRQPRPASPPGPEYGPSR